MGFMEELEALGVNVNEGIDRVMGDQELYESMLVMFVEAVKEPEVRKEDFDVNDLDELIRQIHMLKGIAGNLSLTPLFEAYTETLGLLRENRPKEAKATFEGLLPVQMQIVECIERQNNI